MASCEVFIDTVSPGSITGGGAILAHAWVYLRRGTAPVEVLRTDGRGMLLCRVVETDPVEYWWEYTSPYRATLGETVRVCFSRGARPVPPSELADAVFVERQLLKRPGQRQGRFASRASTGSVRLNTLRLADVILQLPDPKIQLTSPAELQLWPLTQQHLPLGEPYYTDQLAQGAAAWNGQRLGEPEFDPNLASHTLEACRATPPRADIPARGLRVQGTVNQGATRVLVRLLDEMQNLVPLRRASDFEAVTEVEATISGGSFQADFFVEDGAASGGTPVDAHMGLISLCFSVEGNGSFREAFTGYLCAIQAGLVDDYLPNDRVDQPGAPLGGTAEWRVVDFIEPNAPTRPALLALTRTQRMHAYELHFRQRNPSDPLSVHQEMPLWMVELQFLGLRLQPLGELMMYRYFRESGGIVIPQFEPTQRNTVSLSVNWSYTLRIEWRGRNADVTTPYELRQQATASLEFDHAGRLLDSSGVPLSDTALTLPLSTIVSPVPMSGRRVPAVRLHESRRWGRHRPGAPIPGIIFENQPVLTSEGREVLRGGFGTIVFDAVDVGYSGIDNGAPERHSVAAAAIERCSTSTDPLDVMAARLGGPADVRAASAPPLSLPAFRIGGRNLPFDVARRLLESVVRARVPVAGRVTLTQDCWVETAELVILPEAGAAMFGWPGTVAPNTSTRIHPSNLGGRFYGLESGTPIFGPPNGYGVCQIDPPGTDDRLWDYRANINEGLTRLINAAAAARTRFAQGRHYAVVARPARANPTAAIGNGNGSALSNMFNHVSARNAWNRIADTQRGRAMIQREAIRAYGGGFEFTYFAGAGPDGRLESGDDWHIWSTPSQNFWEIHVDGKLERYSRLPGSTFGYTPVARSVAPGHEGQAVFGDGNYGPNTGTGGQP